VEVKEEVKFKSLIYSTTFPVSVYIRTSGGVVALIARSIKKSEVVAYEDLGGRGYLPLLCREFPNYCNNRLSER
jgi:tartrate dehydratase beta subunit/fumarate hydratase class I family protein